jgi:hypothetical protein
MKLENVGEVIASRKLSLAQQEGPPSEVLVLLGKPQKTPGFDDFYCPYQITGAGGNGRGEITVDGHAGSDFVTDTELRFQFLIDQTFLPASRTDLQQSSPHKSSRHAGFSRFPVVECSNCLGKSSQFVTIKRNLDPS